MNVIEPVSKGKNGVAIVANDKVIDWLLPFLESYKATNAEIDLYLIPFDDNVALTRRAAEVYDAIWVDDDMTDLDALARRLYPFSPYLRYRLRKLQSLALPLERVIYIDVDTILFHDLSPLFGRLESGVNEFIIASDSDEYVYNDKYKNHEFLKDARLFSDGFFCTSSKYINIPDFISVMKKDAKLFHSIRKRGGLFCQPLVNFVVHRRNIKVRSLSEFLPGASDHSFYKLNGVSFNENGPIDENGNLIYFAHWAGARHLPSADVFDARWLAYARAAAVRMGQ